jgi:hypothetical protein
VSAKKRILIVTDGSSSIYLIAELIKAALTEYSVKIYTAEKFTGTDLLPAEVFFLGCTSPEPESFSELALMLKHINLASRKCGIFSTNSKAASWLKKILKDSEADTGEVLIAPPDIKAAAVKKWVIKILPAIKTKAELKKRR